MPLILPRSHNLFLPITDNREVASGVFHLSVEMPAPIDDIRPGQFLMLGFPQRHDPLLPRPFAVFDVLETRLEVLYKKVGKGTALLSNRPPGEVLRIFGPLGNGFTLPSSDLPPLIIAGGMGIASVHLLLKKLLENRRAPTLLYGCRGREELVPLDVLKGKAMTCHVITEDGSLGEKGTTVDFLNRLSGQTKGLSHVYSVACVCGPAPMLKAIAEPLSTAGLKSLFSLESRMACGYGVCHGCTVTTHRTSNRGIPGYCRVCTDGPVFTGDEICWESLHAD